MSLLPPPNKSLADFTDDRPPPLITYLDAVYGPGAFDRVGVAIAANSSRVDRSSAQFVGLSTDGASHDIVFEMIGNDQPLKLGWTKASVTPGGTTYTDEDEDFSDGRSFSPDAYNPSGYTYRFNFLIWRDI